MNNFATRTLTGAIFVIVLLGAIILSPITLFVLFGIVTLLGLNEFYALSSSSKLNPNKILGFLGSVVTFVSSCLIGTGVLSPTVLFILIPLFIAVFIYELYHKAEVPFQNIAVTLTGILYIAVPFSLLVLIGFPACNFNAYNPHLIIGFFLLLWSSDTGAYLTGMTLGKHPLFPRISPKKSWEGFIGGVFFTLLVSFILAYFYKELNIKDWIVIATIISVFGVLGDLVESMLKRSLQVKDSGNILPGHGGILDRFDSVILSAPIVFIYLQTKF